MFDVVVAQPALRFRLRRTSTKPVGAASPHSHERDQGRLSFSDMISRRKKERQNSKEKTCDNLLF
jgi:hypothetical protein